MIGRHRLSVIDTKIEHLYFSRMCSRGLRHDVVVVTVDVRQKRIAVDVRNGENSVRLLAVVVRSDDLPERRHPDLQCNGVDVVVV